MRSIEILSSPSTTVEPRYVELGYLEHPAAIS